MRELENARDAAQPEETVTQDGDGTRTTSEFWYLVSALRELENARAHACANSELEHAIHRAAQPIRALLVAQLQTELE